MSFLLNNQESCPRLIDYLVIVGAKDLSSQKQVHVPKLLRRYPPNDYPNFHLPVDVVSFCQPDGCLTNFNKRLCLQETTSFVFTLTEKDSGLVRFGICLNFYRPVDGSRQSQHNTNNIIAADGSIRKLPNRKLESRVCSGGTHSLTSLCLISHYPFFSKFRQCLYILKNIIEKTHLRISKSLDSFTSSSGVINNPTKFVDPSVWSLLLGICLPSSLSSDHLVLRAVQEIECWILRLLSAPSPQPGKKCLYLTVLPESVQDPLVFALPDKTRLSLVDFPLHLPLELLGIDSCLKLLTAIILEQKVVVQSRDYNALTMAVMAFTALLYPLQYMFPVIPLLPTCMHDAEQLLLAPTPYLIGLPASFLSMKRGFQLPSDVWLIDLDSNKLVSSAANEALPPLPEPERSELVQHLQQAMASIHSAPPINNLDQFDDSGLILPPTQSENTNPQASMSSSNTNFQASGAAITSQRSAAPPPPPLIFGNDVDSVDVATRVAMVKFFNSPNLLANFTEHTRTLRLYPRPVVMFQYHSFMRSRHTLTQFTKRLARTQAVEYLAEWSLCPENEVFQRIHSGLYDPSIIGDKPKWYSSGLQRIEFLVCRPSGQCTLHLNWNINPSQTDSDEASDLEGVSTDEEDAVGAVEDDCRSETVSSYSSYSGAGCGTDTMATMDSGISSDSTATISRDDKTAHDIPESQKLTVRLEDVYCMPGQQQPKDQNDDRLSMISTSSAEENDENSSSDQDDSDIWDLKYGKSIDDPSKSPRNRINSRTRTSTLTNHQSSIDSTKSNKLSQSGKPSPIRPPPPSKVGSIGSHPGTPVGAAKAEEKVFFSGNEKPQQVKKKLSKSPHQDSHSNNSSDSEITGLELLKDLGEQVTGAASTINDILGSKGISVAKFTKPYSHLAPKKSLIEKSFLAQQAQSSLKKNQLPQSGTLESKKIMDRAAQKQFCQEQMMNNAQSTENQLYLKEVVQNALKGSTPGIFNRNKVVKLLEDENYRNFVLSKLYVCLEQKVSENQPHVEDVCIQKKTVFKAVQWLLQSTVQGLEASCRNRGLGGMASAYVLLEIFHTHYLSLVSGGGAGASGSGSQASTPDGSSTISRINDDGNIVNAVESANTKSYPAQASPPTTIQRKQSDSPSDQNDVPLGPQIRPEQDMLRNLVMGKSMGKLTKMTSMESDYTSSVVSTSRITHEAIRPQQLSMLQRNSNAGDTNINTLAQVQENSTAPEEENIGPLYPKCKWSGRFRYHCNKLIPLERPISSNPSQQQSTAASIVPRMYLFEVFVNDLDKLRNSIWANLQFWEDVFLDTVAQERDMVGMDQGTVEMMKRYVGLSSAERRRLQLDEDRLLSTLLYNLTAFMLMMRMDIGDVRNKIRRVLASCHLGLFYSQQINHLLDHLHLLQANDIDLKPMVSRLMQRKSFTVHWGSEPGGEILFFEVFDDCIILRSISGAIVDRWWFEKIVHFSFCSKTKVVVFWMKDEPKITHYKLYTKKCKELYNCVKETMGKAASRSVDPNKPPPEMGEEFPIKDRHTQEMGTIQVAFDGLTVTFPKKQLFISIAHVRRCLTQRGDTFIIEMIDPQSKKIQLKKYYSEQASNITYSVLCLFSYLAASLNNSNSNSNNQLSNHFLTPVLPGSGGNSSPSDSATSTEDNTSTIISSQFTTNPTHNLVSSQSANSLISPTS